MAHDASSNVNVDQVEQLFDRAETWLREHYEDRPGFSLRRNLHWPDAQRLKKQLNLQIGPRAGIEIHFKQTKGTDTGRLSIRERGRMELHAQVYLALFGVGLALLTSLVMICAGLAEDWFIRPGRIVAEPHFHGGAFFLGTLIPGACAGIVTTAVAWPFTWLCRPLCRAANRSENLVTPEQMLSTILAGHA